LLAQPAKQLEAVVSSRHRRAGSWEAVLAQPCQRDVSLVDHSSHISSVVAPSDCRRIPLWSIRQHHFTCELQPPPVWRVAIPYATRSSLSPLASRSSMQTQTGRPSCKRTSTPDILSRVSPADSRTVLSSIISLKSTLKIDLHVISIHLALRGNPGLKVLPLPRVYGTRPTAMFGDCGMRRSVIGQHALLLGSKAQPLTVLQRSETGHQIALSSCRHRLPLSRVASRFALFMPNASENPALEFRRNSGHRCNQSRTPAIHLCSNVFCLH
jgi:hypothetical protein